MAVPYFGAPGAEVYVVSGADEDGKAESFYFDTLSGLLLRNDFEASDKEGGTVKVECYLSDYREVEGLKLPHRIQFKRGDEYMTLNFDNYSPNDAIPDSTFDPPE